MNKKTLAIAALALFATSGLASARTIHSPKTEQTVKSQTVAPSPYDAMNQYGSENQALAYPGDNDMDKYHVEQSN